MAVKERKTIKKTKAQIEAEHPIIKPEDCPGAIIDWVKDRDEKRDEREAERDKVLVKMIEETIDKLFDKHFRKYVTMIFTNRALIVILGVAVAAVYGVLLYHIYK